LRVIGFTLTVGYYQAIVNYWDFYFLENSAIKLLLMQENKKFWVHELFFKYLPMSNGIFNYIAEKLLYLCKTKRKKKHEICLFLNGNIFASFLLASRLWQCLQFFVPNVPSL
jgi:hypothetical protein